MGAIGTTGILASLTAFAVVAACSATEGPEAFARTVSVTGTGEAQAPPDQAQISAGVQSFADTVVGASRDNEAAVGRIMAALRKEGIEDRDVGTSNYSIWAEQNYDERNGQRITGYHVSNIVMVTIKDIARVGDVLAAMTTAGANSVNGIEFTVADTRALENEAREEAMADARRRAASLAELAGVQLGEVVSLSIGSGPGYPGPLMARRAMDMASAAAPVPTITPGQQSVSVQVHVTYAIR